MSPESFSLLIAQAAPSPAALSDFLSVGFYLIGIFTAAVMLWRAWRPADISPQPLTVREHTSFATSDDMREVHGRIKREREELNQQISAQAQEVVRLREKLDMEISELHNRINEVPQRTIALLRETKGLI